ncbi:MAG: tRNA(Met) cytidine acetyltransferase TmcA domain-containing protein, partial [Ignisphaera sp.]
MKKNTIKITKDDIIHYVKIDTYVKFKSKVVQELRNALNNNHRLLIILSGDDHKKISLQVADLIISFIHRITKYKDIVRILYVHHDEFSDAVLRRKIINRIVNRYLKNKKINAKL